TLPVLEALYLSIHFECQPCCHFGERWLRGCVAENITCDPGKVHPGTLLSNWKSPPKRKKKEKKRERERQKKKKKRERRPSQNGPQ
uniref:Uncharacterized protein n=1 Tax=Mustela putorius furo TaxID=9669 RepID=M3Z339_MUSPF